MKIGAPQAPSTTPYLSPAPGLWPIRLVRWKNVTTNPNKEEHQARRRGNEISKRKPAYSRHATLDGFTVSLLRVPFSNRSRGMTRSKCLMRLQTNPSTWPNQTVHRSIIDDLLRMTCSECKVRKRGTILAPVET